MARLADLSQPAGVTAVLAEMETHFCVSRLLSEHAGGSFAQGGFVREQERAGHPGRPELLQGVRGRRWLPAVSCCTEVPEKEEKENASLTGQGYV